jgi:hypothetical protein
VLTEATPGGATVTRLERAAIPSLLAERFGLPGFVVRPDGRVVPASG